eukprot:6483932-Amphidinium_carterae.1
MAAEHESQYELAEQRSTTSSSSTGLHATKRVNPPSLLVDDSLLAVGPPRLASTKMSTATTMSTLTDGIYLLSAPKQQLHRREAPTIFEGNSAATLHQPRVRQTEAIRIRAELQRVRHDYNHTHRVALQRNAQKKTRRARNETTSDDEVLPQAPDLPEDYEPLNEDERNMISAYKEAFYYSIRVLQYTLNKATKSEPHRFVLQCNRTNSSRFETWRQLHATHDQGEKAQQLHARGFPCMLNGKLILCWQELMKQTLPVSHSGFAGNPDPFAFERALV